MMQFRPDCDKTRWIALFDLLGTRELLRQKKDLQVFVAYQQAIEELEQGKAENNAIQHTWFSDTFVIVGSDDSGPTFTWVDSLARSFMYFLLQARVPLRGAIACDHVYADLESGVIYGQGLVEAYEYGDGQNWIGLLLGPTACRRLRELGVDPDRMLNYAPADVPWSRKPGEAPDELPACILGNWIEINGENLCVRALEAMAERIDSEAVRAKYASAMEFIRTNQRR